MLCKRKHVIASYDTDTDHTQIRLMHMATYILANWPKDRHEFRSSGRDTDMSSQSGR